MIAIGVEGSSPVDSKAVAQAGYVSLYWRLMRCVSRPG